MSLFVCAPKQNLSKSSIESAGQLPSLDHSKITFDYMCVLYALDVRMRVWINAPECGSTHNQKLSYRLEPNTIGNRSSQQKGLDDDSAPTKSAPSLENPLMTRLVVNEPQLSYQSSTLITYPLKSTQFPPLHATQLRGYVLQARRQVIMQVANGQVGRFIMDDQCGAKPVVASYGTQDTMKKCLKNHRIHLLGFHYVAKIYRRMI